MLESISNQQRVPEKNFIPCIISGHTVLHILLLSFFFPPPYISHRLIFLVFQMAQLADYAFDSRGIAFPLKPPSKRNSHQKCRKSSIYFILLYLAVHLQYGDTLQELLLWLFNICGGQPAKAKKKKRCQRKCGFVADVMCMQWRRGWCLCVIARDPQIDFWWFSVTGCNHPIREYWSEPGANIWGELARTHSRLTSNISDWHDRFPHAQRTC